MLAVPIGYISVALTMEKHNTYHSIPDIQSFHSSAETTSLSLFMNNLVQKINKPFVFLIDSPSNDDLYDGYSIGMALRDALRAIRIPCIYTLAANNQNFESALSIRLPQVIQSMEAEPNTNAIPFIHICAHGAHQGLALTDGTFMFWNRLRQLLLSHNYMKGQDPYVCMASCNGFSGTSMASAFDSAFNVMIGNTGLVFQSDLTVAYLSFYNHIYFKGSNFEQAVQAMRHASGDHKFFYALGEQIKQERLREVQTLASLDPLVTSPMIL